MNTHSQQADGLPEPEPTPFPQRPPAVTTTHNHANLLTPAATGGRVAVRAPAPSAPPTEYAGAAPSAWWLVLILLIGLIFRAALSLQAGHTDDLVLFEAWLRDLSRHGLGEFFNHSNANYPPLHLLTLWAQGRLLDAAGVDLLSDASSPVIRFWLRAPACLADVLIALLLYRECGRRMGSRAALAAAAIYFLNPAALYISAYWGQVDSIHTLFILASLTALNRNRPLCAGFAIGLALLQKLQSIAFLPLVLFDVYRYRRWTGAIGWLIGAGLSVSLVLAPFIQAGSWKPAMESGYLRVLAQYPRLSINAYNLWHIGDHHLIGDFNPPHLLIRAAGDGQTSVADDATWYLRLTWRRIGSLLFVLFTAGVLALYARRHSAEDRALAAAALGMAFFLFPTEMHERYAFPVLGVLAVWAAAGGWRERLYWAFSIFFLLNVAAILPIEPIGGGIGVVMVALFVAMLLALGVRAGAGRVEARTAQAVPVGGASLPAPGSTASAESQVSVHEATAAASDAPPPSKLVLWFCRGTFAAWVVALNAACVLVYLGSTAPWPRETGAVYLTEIEPASVQQQHAAPQGDAEVEGGPLHVGNRYYFHGLGAHARSKLVYPVPPGAARFKAVAGVSEGFEGQVKLSVQLDGKTVIERGPLLGSSPPMNVDLDVAGATTITLVADPDGRNNGDHVDWADARFTK
ncbi:MAG: NPCBM/NEW2 domain-containing protein [Phycisphaerales bacterium]|nr:NPCBM/NEW2 domain-containing protein [Phycisphaerales bacterium]